MTPTVPEEATRDHIIESVIDLLKNEVKRVLSGHHSKKIIIYGAGARGIVLNETLKMMGLEAACFLDSNPEKQNTTILGIPVHEPLRLMYEDIDEVVIIIAIASPRDVVPALEGLGFDASKNIKWLFDNESLGSGIARTEGMPLIDFFLGYNRQSDLPGFKCLGNDTGEEIRILVLGGSTTDPEVMDPMEWNAPDTREQSLGSWPRFLHQHLTTNGINALLFNGGMSSYISGQEMLKLIRDGLVLKPDIVICFDGINDSQSYMRYDSKLSKYHSYFKTVEESISPLFSKSGISAFGGRIEAPFVQGICHGVEADISAFEEWHSNQRIMRAVCEEFDIEYVCFLQPGGIFLKDYRQSCDAVIRRRWFLWDFFLLFARDPQNFSIAYEQAIPAEKKLRELFQNSSLYKFEHVETFYRHARDAAKSNDYIVDIVDALNGYPDVFYDRVHCNMKGNKLIAERIYQELTGRGVLRRALDKAADPGNKSAKGFI
jgi:hypothetical protein